MKWLVRLLAWGILAIWFASIALLAAIVIPMAWAIDVATGENTKL
jgi:hypothetical protein